MRIQKTLRAFFGMALLAVPFSAFVAVLGAWSYSEASDFFGIIYTATLIGIAGWMIVKSSGWSPFDE